MRKLLTIPLMAIGWTILLPLLFIYALFAVCVGFVAMVLDVLTKEKTTTTRNNE